MSDLDHLWRRVDSRERGRAPRESRSPQAGPARDLQDHAAGLHLLNEPFDATSGSRYIAIGRRVVLGGTPAIISHLLTENLISHANILHRRRRSPRCDSEATQSPRLRDR